MTVRVDGTLRRGEWSLQLDELVLARGMTAVVGPNGAGKTSLLRLIAGLEAISVGSVSIGGRVIDEPATSTFVGPDRRPVAMVFQDHRLFPHLRAVDDVAFPLRRRGLDRTTARTRAHELLDRVGMADHGHVRPDRLSGGQRQRVAVARALARDAEVLLLDEPLASIDDASRMALRQLFAAETAPTVVWVTHDPTDAAGADAILTLDASGIRQTAGS